MSSLSSRKTESNMMKKGFVKGSGGKKHVPYNYKTLDERKTTITTHMSHGAKHKVLDDRNISMMAKQCKLGKKEFEQFARCDMSQQEYELILKDQGAIPAGE